MCKWMGHKQLRKMMKKSFKKSLKFLEKSLEVKEKCLPLRSRSDDGRMS